MILSSQFPRLTATNHRITSAADPRYNCIAWSAGDTGRWWQPGVFWPVATPPDDFGLGALERAFQSLGYQDCGMDSLLEPGFEKVALFGSLLLYTHAARQLPDGRWTSKLGREEDIEHETPDDVAGGVYGAVIKVMKRPAAS
ncbi:MAG: hypothetical protein L0Z62_30260 [Gemmataceae bacterium]|nr:hypothetical protein [Gemmataceae bacterium]